MSEEKEALSIIPSDSAIEKKKTSINDLILSSTVEFLASKIIGPSLFDFSILSYLISAKSIEEKKTELVLALQKADIDPLIFDTLLSEEINRRLKERFGYAFLALTFLFTSASYVIIILNSIYKWGIPENAIIALIVETPIQFIGLLYIIARNLFPQTKH